MAKILIADDALFMRITLGDILKLGDGVTKWSELPVIGPVNLKNGGGENSIIMGNDCSQFFSRMSKHVV